jgi:hypothetical protein
MPTQSFVKHPCAQHCMLNLRWDPTFGFW